MESSLLDLSLSELSNALEQGKTTSAEAVESVLAAVEARDADLGAYLHLDAEDGRTQARAADQARVAGKRGPLLGVPIAVKDLINVRDQPCTCGSHMLEGYRATYDATVVTRLREAGAVLLGRLNMDEFAMGSSTENSALKTTRNPWDLDVVPGGSSGGAAAAVAGREAFAALGSDTGGSIRQPAAFCGCVGLKPTYGRVSRYGLTAFASSLDQIGPITRTVRDTTLLLQVLAGPDPRDATCSPDEPPSFINQLGEDIRGLRIGLPEECFADGLDPEVAQAVKAGAERFKEIGAELIPVALPHLRYAVAAYYLIATAEASANLARFDGIRYGKRAQADDVLESYLRTRSEGFGPEVKRRILLGTYALSSGYYDAYYLRAQKVRTLLCRDFDNAFAQADILLAPTTPTPAYPLGSKVRDPLTMYLDDIFTNPVNLAGNCAISIPCGFTEKGLPIGIQLIGPAMEEGRILKAAYAYEQATPWKDRAPAALGPARNPKGAEA